jgi:hypothetical protein
MTPKKPKNRRAKNIGTCCIQVRPPKYEVTVTGGPGQNKRFCCIKGYVQLRTDIPKVP